MSFQRLFQALWTLPGADVWSGTCSWPAEAKSMAQQLSVSALGSMLGCPLALPTLTVPLSRQDQYQLCYRAALEYLGSFDHYAT